MTDFDLAQVNDIALRYNKAGDSVRDCDLCHSVAQSRKSVTLEIG